MGSLFSSFVLLFVLNLSLSMSVTLAVWLVLVLAVCRFLSEYSRRHKMIIGSHVISLTTQLSVFLVVVAPYLCSVGLLDALVPSLCGIVTLLLLHVTYCSINIWA